MFEPAGDGWMATELARGPWSPDALHGGPVAALLAGAAEDAGGDGFFTARISVDILRPIGFSPLALHADVVRPGRKVQLVEARLRDGANEVARAALWRVREDDLDVATPDEPPPFDPPSSGLPRATLRDDFTAFHNSGVEHRFVAGMIGEPGPASDWVRLLAPVVPDRDPSPLQRVLAAADFGNGVSSVLSWDDFAFINPELTVHLFRAPVGEWVALDAVTRLGPHGSGVAQSDLYDERGRIGSGLQALLVDPRG